MGGGVERSQGGDDDELFPSKAVVAEHLSSGKAKAGPVKRWESDGEESDIKAPRCYLSS